MAPAIIRKLLLTSFVSTTALLAACGGGDSNDDGGSTVNKPTAAIQANQARAPIGSVITLNGSGSSSPNGGSLGYAWELALKPESSLAALTNTTTATTDFILDKAGEYIATLVVNDGTASSNSAQVSVTATNPDPVAVIKTASQSVLLNSTVTLDGSASQAPTDADASLLKYQWTLVSQPDGSEFIELQNADQATASFVASNTGEYVAQLVVTHGNRTSTAAEVRIQANVSNSSPVAVVKTPGEPTYYNSTYLVLSGTVGQAVDLDGSDSYDPDTGDTLHYRWRFSPSQGERNKPYISKTNISNHDKAQANFTPDAAGTYYIDFVVYDDSVEATQQIKLDVVANPNLPNTAPIAVINYGSDLECELNGPYAWYQICNIYSYGSGDAESTSGLSYTWQWWNLDSPENKTTSTSSGLQIPSTTQGSFGISLVIKDAGGLSSAAAYQVLHVKSGANSAPESKASTEIARVSIGQTATLSGAGSSDPNNDKLFYKWTLIDQPDNSKATLVSDTSETANLTPDMPGLYLAKLDVNDGKLNNFVRNTAYVSIFAKSKNNPPAGKLLTDGSSTVQTSVFGAADQAICLGCLGDLLYFSINMSDPDNDLPLYYYLSQTKRPENSKAYTAVSGQGSSNPTAATRNFVSINNTLTKSIGDYSFQLIISDGIENTITNYDFSVVNINDYPSLLLRYVDYPEKISRQQFFPYYQQAMSGSQPNLSIDSIVSENKIKISQFALQAFDQDYTISNLKITGRNEYQPSFVGLQDGQVIKKGETVIFGIVRPLIDGEADWDNSASNSLSKFRELLTSYGFSWSFNIKERKDFSFRID